MAGKQVDLDDFLWPYFNTTGRDITLYEHEAAEPDVIKPGERLILPKQRQLLREMFEYDRILWGGAGGGGKCLSPDHDVLVKGRGWVSIADVKVGEYVLSWREGEGGEGSNVWSKVAATYSYEHSGLMRVLRSSRNGSLSFRATLNHRFRGRFDIGGSRNERRGAKKGPWRWYDATELTGDLELPAIGSELPAETNLYNGDELELLGWWIAEGRSVGGKPSSLISQSTPRGVARLVYLAERLGYRHRIFPREGVRIYGWKPMMFCGTNSDDKFIPRELFYDGGRQRLLDGLLGGDGYMRRDGWEYSSNSYQLASDVQELATLIGLRATLRPKKTQSVKPHWVVSAYPRKGWRIPRLPSASANKRPKVAAIGYEHYDGMVYCLEVPDTGVFVTRHNGAVHVTGNSVFGEKIHPYFHIWLNKRYRDKHGKHALHRVDTAMFAETRPDLYARQVSKIEQWLPEWLGTWVENKYEYRFFAKWGGGREAYLSLDRPSRFRSMELAGATFDESTQQPWDSIEQAASRLRSPQLKGICRPWCVLLTNPGGKSHAEHLDNFVDDTKRPGPSVSTKFKDEDGNYIRRRGNRYIPCLPSENPLLDAAWMANLETLSESIQQAILFGKWDGMEGMFFSILHEQVHLIPASRYKHLIERSPKYLGVDIGGAHPFAGAWLAMCPPDKDHPEGFGVFFREYEKISDDLNSHKLAMSDMQENDRHLLYGVISHDAYRKGLTVTGNSSTMDVLTRSDEFGPGMQFVPCPAGPDDRAEGWAKMQRGFAYEGTWIEDAELGRKLKVTREPTLYVTDDCPILWKELKAAMTDKNRKNDLVKKQGLYEVGYGDDLIDAARHVYYMAGPTVGGLRNDDVEEVDDYSTQKPKRSSIEERLKKGRRHSNPISRF